MMNERGWRHADLAQKCGVCRQVIQKNITGKIKTGRRHRFHIGVIATALRNGFEAEALSILLGDGEDKKVSTVLRAAVIYPDLSSSELELLNKAEKTTSMSPLPVEVIKSIVQTNREP